MDKENDGNFFKNDDWVWLIVLRVLFPPKREENNKKQIKENRMDLKEKLTESKLKLLSKIDEKLDSDNLTTEDMKNISVTLSNVISFSDYADKLCGGFNSFGAQRTEGTNKDIN